MNISNILSLSLCLLLAGTATGMAQDTIPTPPGEEQNYDLAVDQWVQPNAEGLLVGQVVTVDDGPIGECKVALVNLDGVVQQFVSDEQGKVTMQDVAPGIYAMTVRGENLVAAYALQVIGPDVENVSRDATFSIGAARVDAAKFYSQIVRYIPAGEDSAIVVPFNPAEARAVVRKIGRPRLQRIEQINGGMRGCLYAPGTENGRLIEAGQVYVFVLRDGLEVDRDVTDAQGCYEFEDLAPGKYSLIAVGQSGVGATGFELVATDVTAKKRDADSPFRLASAVQPPGMPRLPQLNLQIAPPQGALAGFDAFGPPPGAGPGAPPPFPMPPGGLAPPPGFGGGFAGGGPGGGFGGGAGGGAGGGLGGIGGLAGLAGLGLGLAALADDDDEEFERPRPASPASPGNPGGGNPGGGNPGGGNPGGGNPGGGNPGGGNPGGGNPGGGNP